jgi:4'-phosphopantetheinyl transferase
MSVHWLEQTEADVPADNDWLSADEVVCLNGMRFAKRRADWRLGRWTAKLALAIRLHAPAHSRVLATIEIRPAASGAPMAFLAGKPAGMNVSLSHRAGRAMCAVAPPGVELGCDLEVVEPRSDAFIADYFTATEQALVARTPASDRSRLLALLWSAKESTLKALRIGLRVDTRSLVVSALEALAGANDWGPVQVRYAYERIFHGWWESEGRFVRTLVADPPPPSPILLKACCVPTERQHGSGRPSQAHNF